MNLHKFGNYYINVEEILYVHRFEAQISPPGLAMPGTTNPGGARIYFENSELTIYSDEPGYAEFIAWLDGG
jgi:hypothetical protein